MTSMTTCAADMCTLGNRLDLHSKLITHNFTIHTPWMYYDFYFLIFRYNFIAGKLLHFFIISYPSHSVINWVSFYVAPSWWCWSQELWILILCPFSEREDEREENRKRENSASQHNFSEVLWKTFSIQKWNINIWISTLSPAGCWGVARKRVTHFPLSCEYHVRISLEITITSWIGM